MPETIVGSLDLEIAPLQPVLSRKPPSIQVTEASNPAQEIRPLPPVQMVAQRALQVTEQGGPLEQSLEESGRTLIWVDQLPVNLAANSIYLKRTGTNLADLYFTNEARQIVLTLTLPDKKERQETLLRTITAAEIFNKQLNLPSEPTTPSKVVITPQGGLAQFSGTDFISDGSTIRWDGLALDLLIEEGSNVIITYPTRNAT